jgi:hypothetical protein
MSLTAGEDRRIHLAVLIRDAPADYALVTCRALGLSVALGYTNMRGHDRRELSAPSPAEVML